MSLQGPLSWELHHSTQELCVSASFYYSCRKLKIVTLWCIILTSSLVQISSQMKWSHPQENFFLYATRSAHRYNKSIYTGWKNGGTLIIR